MCISITSSQTFTHTFNAQTLQLSVAPDDYAAFPPPEQLPSAFTLDRRRQCFNAAIINDAILEGQEQFTVSLMNLVAQTNFPRVAVAPEVATIIILDDDGECH